MIPWPQLLLRIAEHYKQSPNELAENAESIAKNLKHTNTPPYFTGQDLMFDALIRGTQNLCASHDNEWGGFGGAPKFPQAMALDFLMSMRRTQAIEDSGFAERVDDVLDISLQRMACSGLYDQIGGGFFRYCVDAHWQIPHFEKMLYDNALLLELYCQGVDSLPCRDLQRCGLRDSRVALSVK